MTDSFRPGSVWLITERTAPAWTALLATFNDNQWHDQTQFEQLMRNTARLADRTITNHLRSASRRGWIKRSQGLTKITRPDLIQAALNETQP